MTDQFDNVKTPYRQYPKEIQRQMINYLLNGNSDRDLAAMVLDGLSLYELRKLYDSISDVVRIK